MFKDGKLEVTAILRMMETTSKEFAAHLQEKDRHITKLQSEEDFLKDKVAKFKQQADNARMHTRRGSH